VHTFRATCTDFCKNKYTQPSVPTSHLNCLKLINVGMCNKVMEFVGKRSVFTYIPRSENKCSAVAEMGDRLATIAMGRKLGALLPFGEGELGSHVTQCRLGRALPPYQVAS